jgi:tetratricopeptide (TPR) repeat protein
LNHQIEIHPRIPFGLSRAATAALCVAALAFGCAAAKGTQVPVGVDPAAMQEAMAVGPEESFASPSAYAHFLAARLAYHDKEYQEAAEELRVAVIHDPSSKYLRLQLAEALGYAGAMDRAEAELNLLIQRSPDYAPAHVMLAQVLAEESRIPQAIAETNRGIELDPKERQGYLLLIQLFANSGNEAKAAAQADTVARLFPDESGGDKYLGHWYLGNSEYAKAERYLARAAERSPGDFDLWVALARSRESQGQIDGAIQAYLKALERDSEDLDALMSTARLLFRKRDNAAAEAYLAQAVWIAPDDPKVRLNVGMNCLAAHRVDAAVKYFGEAHNLAPAEPTATYYLGLAREERASTLATPRDREREFRAAAQLLDQVPASFEEYANARAAYAHCLTEGGEPAKAAEAMRSAIAEHPTEAGYYQELTVALAKLGREGEGLALLEKTVADHPTSELFDVLAGEYEHLGRANDAIAVLHKALTQTPKDETLLFSLGALYEKTGRTDESIGNMRQVLAVNPQNAAAMNFIGYTLADRGTNLDEAEHLVQRAMELRPGNGAFTDSMGWVYFKKGDFSRAVELLEQAETLTPGEPVILEHLGDAYARVDRRKEATDAYHRSLQALDRAPDLQVKRSVERKLRDLGAAGPSQARRGH